MGLVRFGSPYGITWVKISIWELLFNTIQQNLLRWVRSQHRNEYNFECDAKNNIKIRPLDSTHRIPSNLMCMFGTQYIQFRPCVYFTQISFTWNEWERENHISPRANCKFGVFGCFTSCQTNQQRHTWKEWSRKGGQRRAQHFNRIHNILLRAQFRNLSSYLVSLRKLLFFQRALYG